MQELALSGVFRTTIEALLAPRRLIPITVVILPLLFLQVNYSYDAFALPLAMAMCATFLLVAPTLWRYFFPLRGRRGSAVLRGVAYGATGVGLILGIGRGVPAMVGMGHTFLTTNPSLLVSVALFWVGGWGLARDIDLEADLKASHARAEALAREAEHAQLLALRSHFDPHFLFNTLNAIAEWCRSDGAVAEQAIIRLSSMLRTVMSGIQAKSWPLSKELELVDTLFQMYLIRDPELFVYRRDVPPELPEIEVPPMILLPAAENAMKHGPSAGKRGDVALRVRADASALIVEIENPGAFKGRRDGGSGLPMIEKRLALTYQEGAMFDIRAKGERTVATIRIPRGEIAR
jgi:two-component system, LytTR family, sensor histidine kinase AlgZ